MKIYQAANDGNTYYILAATKYRAKQVLLDEQVVELPLSEIKGIHPNKWPNLYITDSDDFEFEVNIPDEEKHLYQGGYRIKESFADLHQREILEQVFFIAEYEV